MNQQNKPDPDALRQIHLFEAMDERQVEAVRQTMRVRELSEGERLFDFGQPALHFFFVELGQIKLFRTSIEGSEKVIEIIRPGETFAEAVMFMGQGKGYPVSAQALSICRVWVFDSQTMVALLRDSVDSCFRLMANLSRRLRQQIDEIDRLTLHNATYRVVDYLIRELPNQTRPAGELRLSIPKNVLASRVAIQPETLSRILARLSERGLLRAQRNDIILVDVDQLRAFAGEMS